MSYDPNNLLHSLATFMAAAAGVQYASTPRGLWRNQADEKVAADPYSVLRITGGRRQKPRWDPVPIIAIQCDTRGTSGEAALAQAQKLFNALFDSDGRPLHMTDIPGYRASDNAGDGTYRIMCVEVIAEPGLLGVDDRGRQMVVFNVEIM